MSHSLNKSTDLLPGEFESRRHPNFSHILVTNLGRIFNVNTGNVIGRITGGTRNGKPAADSEKYVSATVLGRTIPVHVLVLEAFVGPRPDGHEPDHINFDRHDNRVENLRWVTVSENQSHKRRR